MTKQTILVEDKIFGQPPATRKEFWDIGKTDNGNFLLFQKEHLSAWTRTNMGYLKQKYKNFKRYRGEVAIEAHFKVTGDVNPVDLGDVLCFLLERIFIYKRSQVQSIKVEIEKVDGKDAEDLFTEFTILDLNS